MENTDGYMATTISPEQGEARAERIAIMVVEGMPEAEAVAFCNSRPEIYGGVPCE